MTLLETKVLKICTQRQQMCSSGAFVTDDPVISLVQIIEEVKSMKTTQVQVAQILASFMSADTIVA